METPRPADSPFRHGVQYAFDSTSLGWFKECPKKYEYQMLKGYSTKSEQVNLIFGIWYHTALETYYKLRAKGASHEDSLRTVVNDALLSTWYRTPDYDGPWISDHDTKNRLTLIRSIIWYLEEWGQADPCETVVLDNGQAAVELSFRFDIGQGRLLSGHLDRLVSVAGDTFVMDHKTTKTTVSSSFFDKYKPDNQMSLYTLAARVMYRTPVQGVMIDAIQIAVGFSKVTRGFTYRTEAELDEWLEETHEVINQIEDATDRQKFLHNDKACGNYGGCPFRKVCGSDPRIRDELLKSDYAVRHWNPLQSR